jgi:hypothetical protein
MVLRALRPGSRKGEGDNHQVGMIRKHLPGDVLAGADD